MNVLSLFDGISCGQVALRRAGITYDTYYASEIDKHVISVTQRHFPHTVQLGSVSDVKAGNLPHIDLLLGGSPCQGFSSAGKHLNFEDPRSALFFEYVRLLQETRPTYFLLENVRMKATYREHINNLLGVQAIEIDSALVSGQMRKRLYWTNIPGITQPHDRGITLQSVLETAAHTYKDKAYALRAGQNSNAGPCTVRRYFGKRIDNIVLDNGVHRVLTPVEMERLQTLPDDYTAGIPKTQRYKALGNGWTVDVIAHIFSFLPKEFLNTSCVS